MQARLLHLHPMTAKKLLRLKKGAEADGAYRVARRLHAVLLNHDGYTSGQIATLLKAFRSSVSEWLRNYEQSRCLRNKPWQISSAVAPSPAASFPASGRPQ